MKATRLAARSTRMPFPEFTPTIPVLLRTTAERFGPRALLVVDGERLTHAEADARSAALARGLLAQGLGKGARVGILMPNGVDWALAWFATTRIGAIAVLLNTFHQARELAWSVRHSDVSHVLASSRFMGHDPLARLEAALPGLRESDAARSLCLHEAPYLRAIHTFGPGDRHWARAGESELVRAGTRAGVDAELLAAVESAVTPADAAVIVYSSGSTADPKGAIHTQGTLVRQSLGVTDTYPLESGEVLFSSMPFFWVGGLITGLLACQQRGATLVTQARFEPGEALDLLERERVTQVTGWPHQGKTLAEHPSFASRDLSRIRRSSMPQLVPPERRAPEIHSEALGMTETCSLHSGFDAYAALPPERRGTYGRPLEGMSVRIIDPETGEVLPPRSPGEICVRGQALMQGLYKLEREQVFLADGFYRTGDAGWLDEEGWLYFTGRLGEMIKTAGSNVTPAEVEAALLAHPEVQEAYVTGIPDPDRGQLVVAAVVPRAGRSLAGEELRVRLKADLSAYKVPRHIWICRRHELPFTESGKLRKAELSRRIAQLVR
jgi:acyl-CoA synthetase (AMP-forming)/AMP-acid ligase II